MVLFESAWSKSILDIQEKALSAFQQEDYDSCVIICTNGLSTLQSRSSWPMLCTPSRAYVVGVFYLLMARAKLESVAPRQLGDEPNFPLISKVINDILNDLESALNSFFSSERDWLSLIDVTLTYIRACALHPSISAETIEKCFLYLKSSIELASKLKERKYLALSLQSLGNMHFRHKSHDYFSTTQAIQYLEQAVIIFNEVGDLEHLYSTKRQLSHIYQSPFMIEDIYSLEHSIRYAREAMSIQLSASQLERDFTLIDIASAFMGRIHEEPYQNWQNSLIIFDEVFQRNPVEVSARFWPLAINDWMEIVMKSGLLEFYWDEFLAKLDYLLHKYERAAPLAYFQALKIQFYLSRIPAFEFSIGSTELIDKLIFLRQSLNLNEHIHVRIEADILIAELRLISANAQDIENAIPELEVLLNKCDQIVNVDASFKTHILICFCYFQLERWNEGNKRVAALIENLTSDTKSAYRGLDRQLYSFPASPQLMKLLPYYALKGNEVEQALRLFDIIHCRSIAGNLEDLFLIDTQVNRESLMVHYVCINQGNRLVNQFPERDAAHYIERVAHSLTALDAVKLANQDITRSFFYEQLNLQLSKINSWVLIPILGEKSSFLILIPPNSSLRNVVVTEQEGASYWDHAQEIFGEGVSGEWFDVVNPVAEELPKPAFRKMEKYLWDKFGAFLYERVFLQGRGNFQVCIIASGPLMLFPFAIAKDPNLKFGLLDIAEISYAPSLYSLYSLQQRVSLAGHTDRLCCISAPPDKKAPLLEATAEIALRFCAPEVGSKHLIHGKRTLDDVSNALKKSSHWLFSSHSDFSWTTPTKSALNLDDVALNVSIIEVIEASEPLRLVMLASCFGGLKDYSEKDADQNSFFNKFLTVGAIGIVASLWGLNDLASFFLCDRFFFHHFEENYSPATSLRKSQLWVRSLSVGEVTHFINEFLSKHEEFSLVFQPYLSAFGKSDASKKPFTSSYYWGGLMLMGQ